MKLCYWRYTIGLKLCQRSVFHDWRVPPPRWLLFSKVGMQLVEENLRNKKVNRIEVRHCVRRTVRTTSSSKRSAEKGRIRNRRPVRLPVQRRYLRQCARRRRDLVAEESDLPASTKTWRKQGARLSLRAPRAFSTLISPPHITARPIISLIACFCKDWCLQCRSRPMPDGSRANRKLRLSQVALKLIVQFADHPRTGLDGDHKGV